MRLDEFYEEAEAEASVPQVQAQVIDDFNYDDDILPPNVIKSYVQGQIVYQKLTEDGRLIRIDEFDLPY